MKIEIAAALLSAALLSACSTTSQTTAGHQTLEQRMMAKYADTGTTGTDAPNNVYDNPALVPTPALRQSAASGL